MRPTEITFPDNHTKTGYVRFFTHIRDIEQQHPDHRAINNGHDGKGKECVSCKSKYSGGYVVFRGLVIADILISDTDEGLNSVMPEKRAVINPSICGLCKRPHDGQLTIVHIPEQTQSETVKVKKLPKDKKSTKERFMRCNYCGNEISQLPCRGCGGSEATRIKK